MPLARLTSNAGQHRQISLSHAQLEDEAAQSSYHRQSMPIPTVLLVNDDPVTNILHEAILQSGEVCVRIVENGCAAVSSCIALTPDAIVMDIDMPVMNGLDAMRELQALHRAGALPYIGVVATSAVMDESRRNECKAAGALAVLAKPIAFDELLHAVRRAIDATRNAHQMNPTA